MRLIYLFLLFTLSVPSLAQRTDNPYVVSQSSKDFKVDYVEITDNSTIVSLIFNGGYGKYFNVSRNMKLITYDGYYKYSYPIRAISDGVSFCELDKNYATPNKKSRYRLNLIFDRIESGCTSLDIDENVSRGWKWYGIHIVNPVATTPHYNFTEKEIKDIINRHNDGICGIYEGMNKNGLRLACIYFKEEYWLIYLGAQSYDERWKVGDVKAHLRSSASSSLFKADWYLESKRKNNDVYVIFDGMGMKVNLGSEEYGFIKMYPSVENNNNTSITDNKIWSGTGFALKDGYIATNYHVIDGAKNIKVLGINGAFNEEYDATIVATDKINDLAIIRITDSRFNEFGNIPYNIKTTTSDVGEEIFVLGYPLTSSMGDEIKLTTGVVSSRTGFQGDISLYQISAPIQPGNSGGPLFDYNGNIIGIVNAKHAGAENVGYAIKSLYLKILMESFMPDNILPTSKNVYNLPLTSKVKTLKNYVYMIKCSNGNFPNVSNSNIQNRSYSGNSNYDTNYQFKNDIKREYNSCIYTTNSSCKINKIVVTNSETIIHLEIFLEGNGYWCSISPDTYISFNGSKLPLINASNIALSPGKTIADSKELHRFALIFPVLPQEIEKFDLIEPGNSSWKFYNIQLK